MYIHNAYHLTYCTNIHSEKNWSDLFASLSATIPVIKKEVSPDARFGIGLRLSDYSSKEILEEKNLMKFKTWLDDNGLYVFTMNGFPYGLFHNKVVKDDVHKPDWTTKERVEYTKRLCRILAVLLPKGMEGGISTSPLSYKPWHEEEKRKEHLYKTSAVHLAMMTGEMLHIRKDSGKVLHVDIEPEPDGLLERSAEVIEFFEKYLLTYGAEYLIKNHSISPALAEEALRTHIRICYDICHFAVAYEDHAKAFAAFEKAGIRIGKIQISSALKAVFEGDKNSIKKLYSEFGLLNDKTYLHQVLEMNKNNLLVQYRDLPEAISAADPDNVKEWRMHFHVPLFVESYGRLKSTQEDVIHVMDFLKEKKITDHLEVETYTWEVLPKNLKMDLTSSICRELKWVMDTIEVSVPSHE